MSECDHEGIDSGPCLTHKPNPKYCGDCCPKCHPRFIVWHKDDPKLIAEFKAPNHAKARHAGFRAMREAGYKIDFLDMRAARIK